MAIRSLCLFCGSRAGADPAHSALAEAFGRLLAARGVTLVYGGGALGLMGIAARAALAGGGRVIGVIPEFLKAWEVAEPALADLRVVPTLHARKALMHELSDAVVALPGGWGTYDELFEVLSWRNLGLHTKPIWLLGGAFWRPFEDLLRHTESAGFGDAALGPMIEPLDGLDALAARLI